MKKILFVSHEASRTGAPSVLLSLMEKIKSEELYQFDVLLINEKEEVDILEDFRGLTSNVFVWNRKKKTAFWKLFNVLFFNGLQELHERKLLKLLKKNNYTLIYANSVASSKEALIIKNYLSISTILHVHELEYLTNWIVGNEQFSDIVNGFDYFIAVSYAVRDNLINNYGVPSQKIKVVYSFTSNLDAEKIEMFNDDIYDQLSISDKTFVVGAAGSVYWVKGFDIFILLADYFCSNYPEVDCLFTWVGNVPSYERMQIDHDLKKLNLTDKVKFVGKKSNPMHYFNAFDIFVLTSREESFGLVCLESATLSKPVICFDKVGGIVEFVEDDAGFVVPYLSIKEMAEKIFILYQNENLRKKMGAKAKEKAIAKYSKEISIESILKVIDDCLN